MSDTETKSTNDSFTDQTQPIDSNTTENVAENVSAPESDLDIARRQSAEYLDMLQRMKADFDNFRKRKDKERAQMADLFRGEVIADLLPTLDALVLAVADTTTDLAAHKRGVELITENLKSTLAKLGLETLSLRGTSFDPNLAEAVTLVPHSEAPESTIIEELSCGYRLNGRVLRPAQVIVSSGPPQQGSSQKTHNNPDSFGGESK